jgi:hypothetical protein
MVTTTLYPNDCDDLANAVRRDMRVQEQLAQGNDPYAKVHGYNAHRDKQLLELLKPKHYVAPHEVAFAAAPNMLECEDLRDYTDGYARN